VSEPIVSPMRLQLTRGQRITVSALLPTGKSSSEATPLPGHRCEVCLDAPAVRLQPTSWGGEMGGCTACAPAEEGQT
jgi:hypothetical protein